MAGNCFLLGLVITAILLICVPASASGEYTLGIFGNANGDDTINIQDMTYTERIILEYRDRTELSDGKYDGKINMQDVTQIELIILGREKELTFLDSTEDAVTVAKPVERLIIVAHDTAFGESVKAIDAKDKVVGIDSRLIERYTDLFPELTRLPSVGTISSPDYEAILSLDPDVIFTDYPQNIGKDNIPGVAVVYLKMRDSPDFKNNIRKLGYILDKKDESNEFINWREALMDDIKTRTVGLTDGEKPKVIDIDYTPERIIVQTPNGYLVTEAGGIDLGAELPGYWPHIDAEWLLEEDPDVVLLHIWKYGTFGYGVDDPSEMEAQRAEFMNAPEFANLKAVKSENVYCHSRDLIYGCGVGLAATAYMAKWFHPDLFEDLDPEAIHQEYLTEFQGLNYNLNEHGVFMYPRLEAS